jgi:hypothetical protein
VTRRGGRNRGSTMVTILWRDIPAQVTAGDGADRCRRILPRRFQKAIDRAAMVAGRTQASDYVAEWRRTAIQFSGDPTAATRLEAERLEAEFPLERLNELVASGGWDPARPESDQLRSSSRDLSETGDNSP